MLKRIGERLLRMALSVLAIIAVGISGVWADSAIEPVSSQEIEMEVPLGGNFYCLTESQEIWKWAPGDTTFTHYSTLPSRAEWEESWRTTPFDRLPEEAKESLRGEISCVSAGDGKLWALNYYTGRIGEIQAQGITWLPQKMDTSHLLRPDESAMIYFYAPIAFVQSGNLYLFGDNGNHLGGHKDYRVLVSLDLQSGTMRVYDTKQAVTICQEEPGFVLVVRKGKGKTQIISRLNLESGEMTDLPAVIPFRDRTDEGLDSLGGLAYRSDTKKIYFCFGKTLYELADDGQSFQAIREMPAVSGWSYRGWALQDDTYVITMERHLYHLPLYEK